MGLCVGTASAQFGFGIVYDPTNYANALLRYYQLEQQLVQLKNSYTQLVTQYNLALQMSRNIQNMPARYRAQFSQWRNAAALNTYGNTGDMDHRHQLRPTRIRESRLPAGDDPAASVQPEPTVGHERRRTRPRAIAVRTVELADGANTTAMATIGSIRGNAQNIQTQIGNLEQDSLSNDPDLNTEVSVLNKINAAGVLTLRTLQDSNKLLASLLEEQTILAKQQREATANTINADIQRQASMSANMTQVTGTLTNSLQNFRMP